MYSTLYVILRLFLYSSVADPESFSADPDPTFYADADPDPNFFNYGEKKCFFLEILQNLSCAIFLVTMR